MLSKGNQFGLLKKKTTIVNAEEEQAPKEKIKFDVFNDNEEESPDYM